MWPRKKREKVVAEITAAYLVLIAKEQGRLLDQQQAVQFLNEEGRAYGMWKEMMNAGEGYIRLQLVEARQAARQPIEAADKNRLSTY